MGVTNEQREWLTLALVPGVGTAHFIRLLARFHTAREVLQASRGALEDVVGPAMARRISTYADAVDVDAQIRALQQHDAQLITLEDAAYPLLLAEVYDPPLALYVRGELSERDAHCVALVGTRRATPYGIRMAEKFGRELAARGITVVSGMASGIDTAAHRGALEAGGRTIAVLGCGVDVVYPEQNAELMQQIIQSGAVVSQYPMGMKPLGKNFPPRNRVISGLSLGVLIVEAPVKSGALITARHASEQGREVFAIPGEIGKNNSQGPHALIRDGAKLVETVDDVLVELNVPAQNRRTAPTAPPPSPAPAQQAAAPSLAPSPSRPPADIPVQEADVLSVLSPNGSYVDEIAEACRISISEALRSLTVLELKGLVRQFSGKRFAPQ
jgi:DNA processing protein